MTNNHAAKDIRCLFHFSAVLGYNQPHGTDNVEKCIHGAWSDSGMAKRVMALEGKSCQGEKVQKWAKISGLLH